MGFVHLPAWTSPAPLVGTPVPPTVRGWLGYYKVVAGTAYTLRDAGTIAAFGLDGSVRWTLRLPATPGPAANASTILEVVGNQIAVEREPPYEQAKQWQRLDMVDLAARRVVWSHQWNDEVGPLVLDHAAVSVGALTIVVVPESRSSLIGLDMATGRTRWRRPGLVSAQVMAGTLIGYQFTGDTSLERIAPASGRVIWRYVEQGSDANDNAKMQAGQISTNGTDRVIGDTAYLAWAGQLVALDTATGHERWRDQSWPLELADFLPGDDSGVLAFGLTADGNIMITAVDARTGAVRGSQQIGVAQAADFGGSPGTTDTKVDALRCGGVPYVVAVNDEGKLWLLNANAGIVGTTSGLLIRCTQLYGDTLLGRDENGLRAIALPQLTDRWRLPLTGDQGDFISDVIPPAVVLRAGDSETRYTP